MRGVFVCLLVSLLLSGCVIPPREEASAEDGTMTGTEADPCRPGFAHAKEPLRSDEEHAMASELSLPSPVAYEVTMHVFWNAADHPADFPPNLHFSPLAGGPHSEGFRLWQPGEPASPAIEMQAETGDPEPLRNAYRQGGTRVLPNQFAVGDRVDSPGRTTVAFRTDSEHTFLSVTSRLAPSPDWFVGVAALPLTSGGAWIEEVVIPLCVWDAGTDDGRSYASANEQPEHPQPIHLLRGRPLSAGSEQAAQVGELILHRTE